MKKLLTFYLCYVALFVSGEAHPTSEKIYEKFTTELNLDLLATWYSKVPTLIADYSLVEGKGTKEFHKVHKVL